LGDQAVLDDIRRAPFAGDQRIVAEVPPGVIGEVLRPALHLPLAAYLEALVIHQEDAARTFAVPVAERRDIDAFGTAMHRVRPGVAGELGDLAGLDYLDELRV